MQNTHPCQAVLTLPGHPSLGSSAAEVRGVSPLYLRSQEGDATRCGGYGNKFQEDVRISSDLSYQPNGRVSVCSVKSRLNYMLQLL